MQFKYLGQCDSLRKIPGNETNWQLMIKHQLPISIETFEEVCDCSPILEPDETIYDFIAGDRTSGFFVSIWAARPCMFIQTHGFEFIFVLI